MILLYIYLFVFFAIVIFDIIFVVRVLFWWPMTPTKQTYKDQVTIFFLTIVAGLFWPVALGLWAVGGICYMISEGCKWLFPIIGGWLHGGVLKIRSYTYKEQKNCDDNI